MNFTSHFEFHIIPEWSEFYLDYKNLNTMYKKISKYTNNNTNKKSNTRLKIKNQ